MKEYKELRFKSTSMLDGCKEISMHLINLGNGDYETLSGTIIHIFDKLPFMRNIPANKHWFVNAKYHFN